MAILKKSALAALSAASAANALYVNGSVTAPCDSPIYCHGEILKEIELAKPFEDSKTFVDMPALKPVDEIRRAFDKLEKPLTNNTALNDFLSKYFADAGGELHEVPEDQLKTDPVFLEAIDDSVIREFTEKVIDIWPELTRTFGNAPGSNCTECPTSFIPIKRSFVVAGGRFREPYYWDTYWILEGLLRTGGSFVDIARNTIENFLDLVDKVGFVPNGARIYYLNRSQPPVLSQMVRLYIEHTNDTEILDRALPLLVKEHDFFMNNRTVDVEAGGKTYTLNHYAVENNQPRPESYREDYETARNTSYYSESGIIYPQVEALNDTELGQLYSNLASGAESGWDYSSRWIARPDDAARDNYFPLRYLNTVNIVPVDLNSLMYANEMAISEFFNQTGNSTAASSWADLAARRSEAMHSLMWNDTHFGYFDYNITSSSQRLYVPADSDSLASELSTAPKGHQVFFSVAQFYPFWTGAAPDHIKANPLAVRKAYSRVAEYLDARAGGIPATNFRTGQQWDQPSVWPPLQHILMAGLRNVPPTFGKDDPDYKDVHELALRLGQRYLDSTFCTWRATGGSTSETPQLPGLGDEDVGIMFEKYADNSTNTAGGGGEYEVVEGFGWTNGVLIWTVDTFGNELERPECGDLEAANTDSSSSSSSKRAARSAVQLSVRDAQRTKKFGRRNKRN
ncbi:Trehalase-like protein [Hapsidospora chrysogenum ATCC 11550]|uniref:Trehalase n=1 Tax=Hapsidospora chrysogenum (strain ATCC 11550 / CBS 779.69 / DSM 880 / IAM 14645 / JCM 23072 / IMI 49137) TaxID=857340 RepID=A0A086T7H3_HAPC1|nr:Trehalase-like protein [Hapsidospora chrysogenum ATCC 11550]